MTLDDLRDLCEHYVPELSRHPNSWHSPELWWNAHELGHLLTVPAASIGLPMFGLDDDSDPDAINVHERRCRELAAMSVSRRLLEACGRPDLAADELEGTDYDTVGYADEPRARRRVRAIMSTHRCLHIPRTRAGLEAKLKRVTARAK